MKQGRCIHGCMAVRENNKIVAVYSIAGWDGRDYDNKVLFSSSEILTVDDMIWKSGPSLPESLFGNSAVASKSSEALGYSVAGSSDKHNYGRYEYKIWELKRKENIWKSIQSSRSSIGYLQDARHGHTVVNAEYRDLPGC